jgi:hypothetical protein
MPLRKKKKDEPDLTDEFGGIESEEEDDSGEDGSGSDDDAPIYKVADEDDQVALDPPVKYQARTKAKIRITSAVDSDEVGIIEKNGFITATHTKDVNGQVRLRFNRGWTSYKSAKGYNLMMKEGEENPHYKQVPRPEGKEIDIRKEADPASEVVGKLQKLSIFEALEVKDPESPADEKFPTEKLKYVRLFAGWVSTHEVSDKMVGGVKKGITETACLVEEKVHDPEGDARREKETLDAAKQAKLAEKQAKKAGKQEAKQEKKKGKQGLSATKTELASVQAFDANLAKALAALPATLEESMKADLQACKTTSAAQVERLQKEVADLDGTNLKQQKATVVAIGKWEAQLGALLASMPESMVASCAADIEYVAASAHAGRPCSSCLLLLTVFPVVCAGSARRQQRGSRRNWRRRSSRSGSDLPVPVCFPWTDGKSGLLVRTPCSSAPSLARG